MGNGLIISYDVIRLNLKHTWTIARNSTDFKENVIVKVKKDGITGFGEVAPNVRYDETVDSTIALIENAIPLFEKYDPWNYVELGFEIKDLDPIQTAAKAGLDIALLDWITKSLNIPLFKFYGLNKGKTPVTTFSIGIDSIDMMIRKVKEAEKYPILKIKLGLQNDEDIIEAIRSETNKPLRIDANEGWKDKKIALEKINWLSSKGVEFVEQPMPSDMLDDVCWLRERANIPIIADESVKTTADIPALAKAFDGINIKLMKAGGLQEALRMLWIAKSLGMKVMLGCMVETSCAISAAASISPLVDYADLDGNLLITNDPFEGAIVEGGKLILNENPGVGITIKE